MTPLQEIKSKTQALQQAVMKIGESLAGKGGEGGGENVQVGAAALQHARAG